MLHRHVSRLVFRPERVILTPNSSRDILQVYLISDLVSASSIPVLVIGLSDACYWWRGFEVVVGGLGGLFTVFIFGTIYYGNAHEGAYLLLLEKGLYASDWGAFGAFVAAPVGGLLWAAGAFAFRIGFQWIQAKGKGHRFDSFDRPPPPSPALYTAHAWSSEEEGEDHEHSEHTLTITPRKGKFF